MIAPPSPVTMPGHENWSIVSFPDHYYHLLLPKSVTDADSAYYKGRHGAEIAGLESLRSVWNYPIRPAVAPRWDAFKWRSNITAPSRDVFFNIVDRTDNSVHRVRRRYRYYVKSWRKGRGVHGHCGKWQHRRLPQRGFQQREEERTQLFFLLFCFICELKKRRRVTSCRYDSKASCASVFFSSCAKSSFRYSLRRNFMSLIIV